MAGANHNGPEIRESAQDKAERIVVRELARLEWTEKDLRERAKGNLDKIQMAELLRRESTMTLRWIAERLSMGTVGHLSHLLYWRRRGVKPGRQRSGSLARESLPRAGTAGMLPARSSTQRQAARRQVAGGPGHEATMPSTESQPFAFDPSFD